MTKLRKQRRRKTYRHNVNRKRMRNKLNKTGNIACKEIKNEWNPKLSIKSNLSEMGLSYDPNVTLKIPQYKEKLKSNESTKGLNGWEEEDGNLIPSKAYVANLLEAEAKAPRIKSFRLPDGHVEKLTKLVEKHGNDFKAMARDRTNYYQETWKQIRAKIKRLQQIPEQCPNIVRNIVLEQADSSDGEI